MAHLGSEDTDVQFNSANETIAVRGSDDAASVANAASPGETVVFLEDNTVEGITLVDGVEYRVPAGVTLSLPGTPSDHMFKSPTTTQFDAGAIIGAGELDGGGTTTYDAINFDNADRLEQYEIERLFVHDFRRGFSGSGNDRKPSISRNRFHNNEVGIYVRDGGHPLTEQNDLRANTTGLGGDIFDMQSNGDKFNYNTAGIEPLDGGQILNSQFSDAHFFRSDTAATLGKGCTVTGGMVVPGDAAGNVGIECQGNHTIIDGVYFRTTAGTTFDNGAISVGSAYWGTIKGCQFEEVGTMVDFPGTDTRRMWNIADNTWRTESDAVSAISMDSGTLNHCQVHDNEFFVGVDLAGAHIVDINNSAWGCSFDNNTFEVTTAPSTTTYALNIDADDGTCTGNRIRRTDGINYVSSNANTVPAEADLGDHNVIF